MSLKGGPELKARLRAIRKSFKPIGRTWADETAKAARPMVPVKTGRLKRSIRRRNASMKRATVVAHYTAYFIDKGTVPHTIKAKRGRSLVFQGKNGTVFARAVHHRGSKAQPFREKAAREGLRRTPMADELIGLWNAAGGRGGLR